MLLFGADLRRDRFGFGDCEKGRRGSKECVQLNAEDLNGRGVRFYVYPSAVLKWIIPPSMFYS